MTKDQHQRAPLHVRDDEEPDATGISSFSFKTEHVDDLLCSFCGQEGHTQLRCPKIPIGEIKY